MNIEIARIGAADLHRVRALAEVIWPATFAGLIPEADIPRIVERVYAIAQLEADIAAGHVFWVATAGARDAGFAAAFKDGATIWIKKLYVHMDFQGAGVGRGLLDAAVAAFAPAESAALFVKSDNEKAIAFYERVGFAKARLEPVVMGHMHFTDWVMTRPLRD